jgi:hypothetical protein
MSPISSEVDLWKIWWICGDMCVIGGVLLHQGRLRTFLIGIELVISNLIAPYRLLLLILVCLLKVMTQISGCSWSRQLIWCKIILSRVICYLIELMRSLYHTILMIGVIDSLIVFSVAICKITCCGMIINVFIKFIKDIFFRVQMYWRG